MRGSPASPRAVVPHAVTAYLRQNIQKRFGDRRATVKTATLGVVNRTGEKSVVRLVFSDPGSWTAEKAGKTARLEQYAR